MTFGINDDIKLIPKIMSDFELPTVRPNANLASEYCKRLTEMLVNFESQLDEQHEIGIRLVNFGQSVVFHLEEMGYYNPSIITFGGVSEDGSPVELIQHISQISRQPHSKQSSYAAKPQGK